MSRSLSNNLRFSLDILITYLLKVVRYTLDLID